MNDLFKSLGPIAIFSAKKHWTAPRSVQLHRGRTTEGFGFSVRGDAPVIIAVVEPDSLSEVSFSLPCVLIVVNHTLFCCSLVV